MLIFVFFEKERWRSREKIWAWIGWPEDGKKGLIFKGGGLKNKMKKRDEREEKKRK